MQKTHHLSRILKWFSLRVTVWSACDLFSLMEHEWVRSISKQVSEPVSFINFPGYICHISLTRTLLKETVCCGIQSSDRGTKNSHILCFFFFFFVKDWLNDLGTSWFKHKVKITSAMSWELIPQRCYMTTKCLLLCLPQIRKMVTIAAHTSRLFLLSSKPNFCLWIIVFTKPEEGSHC